MSRRNADRQPVLRTVCLIMGLIAASGATRADEGASHTFLTAEQLLGICRASGHSPAQPSPAAMLYLMGVVDAAALDADRSREPLFCLPDGTGQATLGSLVCTFIDGHTAERDRTAVSFAYAALRSSFPCR